MRLLATIAFLVIGTICSSFSLRADEPYWNQFRGPYGDGSSRATNLPVTFGEGSPEIVWKTPIPGRAWSSPVVWKNQIWLTNGPEIQNTSKDKPKLEKPLILSAVCVDLSTGKVIHDIKLFEVDQPQFTHATNSYASPTPYIEEGRVYIHFGAYGTACLDTSNGKTLWERRDIECDHFRGPGSSPVVYGDLLYLTFDGYDKQFITALDKKTGKTVWRSDRNIDFGTTDGDAKKAYSTPSLLTVAGREMLISPFAAATIAYDPKSGDQVWMVRHGGMNAAGRPLFGNGLVYINSADGPNPLVAVNPEGTGDISKNIVWRTNKSVPKRGSQILVGDLMFMVNDSGVASCLDAKTGQEIWTKRLGGDYWSSPLYANGLIYCVSQSGLIPVFKAAREFELVAENKLVADVPSIGDNKPGSEPKPGVGFNASPAVAGDSILIRSKTHLYRIEKSKGAAAR